MSGFPCWLWIRTAPTGEVERVYADALTFEDDHLYGYSLNGPVSVRTVRRTPVVCYDGEVEEVRAAADSPWSLYQCEVEGLVASMELTPSDRQEAAS